MHVILSQIESEWNILRSGWCFLEHTEEMDSLWQREKTEYLIFCTLFAHTIRY
jgi:hypothetical protein